MAENWNRGSQPTETTRLLSQSVKLANENEAIAEKTLEEVVEQGDKIENARFQVESIKDMGIAARASVNSIKSKMFQKKFQLWTVIIILFCIDLYLLVRMIRGGGSLYK